MYMFDAAQILSL